MNLKPLAWLAGGVLLLTLLAMAAMHLERQYPTRRAAPTVSAPTGRVPAGSTQNDLSAAVYSASFPDLAGRVQRLGQWSDRILVLNFWATWCAPCREEMPAFSRLQGEWQAKGVQFVGISVDSREKVGKFSETLNIRYPLLVAESGGHDFSKQLGNRLGFLPHTVILLPGGRTVLNHVGPLEESLLRNIFGEIATK
jgi:thiol-disulfide isomerase/thioredoxin